MNDDDRDLEHLLRWPLPNLPDAGFSAAVMQRVQALPPMLAAEQALDHLRRQQVRDARCRHLVSYASALGAALALAWLAAAGGVPGEPAALLPALGVALSGAAVGWTLLNAPA